MADRGRSARSLTRRRSRRRRAVVVVVAAAVLAGCGGIAWAMTGNSGPRYRLATAATGSVRQVVTTVGTVGSVNKATASFAVSGTVASVPVTVGQQVTKGQRLASLATSSLTQQVNAAAATLARAQQTLASDEAGQTAASGGSSGSGDAGPATDSAFVTPLAAAPTRGRPAPTSTPTHSGSQSTTNGSAKQAVGTAQRAVAAAQSDLTKIAAALDAALIGQGDLQTLDAACSPTMRRQTTFTASPVIPAGQTTGTITGSAYLGKKTDSADTVTYTKPGSTQSTPVTSSADGTFAVSGLPAGSYTFTVTSEVVDASACADGIASIVGNSQQAATGTRSLQDLQLQVRSAQTQLTTALADLAQATQVRGGKTASGKGTGTSSGQGARPAGRSTNSGGNRGNPGEGGTSAGTGDRSPSHGTNSAGGKASQPATAQQLAADQAQIDAAGANLTMAKQNLDQATLTSPITGTVASVGLTPGSPAGAESITVLGPGSYQVSTTVALTDIGQVKIGQQAAVVVDGITGTLRGTVTSIGVLGSTSGSSTSYPVTIGLAHSDAKLYDGTGATVTITTGEVDGMLTVPSSAVHALGRVQTVTVLKNGEATTARVTVGAVGASRTQIKSGLSAGAQVVLADLDAAVPSNTSGVTGRLAGLIGGGGRVRQGR